MKIIMVLFLTLQLSACGKASTTVNQVIVLDALYQQYDQWQGTPYRLGGYSKQGIDCSGFVALTFSELFEVQLPRSTKNQAHIDAEIPKALISTGDLVFFKIPKQGDMYHVGIYLNDGNFLHASTSKGVMISNLQAQYWADNYWKTIRVLP